MNPAINDDQNNDRNGEIRQLVKEIKDAMVTGSKNGIKELQTAGLREANLCPICFTNEIESDQAVEIGLKDSKTV